MRLKVESQMVLHANSLHIHDNGLDREYNRTTGTQSHKIAPSHLIHSTGWVNDYNATEVLGTNENYQLQQTQLRLLRQHSPTNSLADDEDGQHSSGTSSSDVSPDLEDYRSLSQSSDTESENPRPPTNNPRGIVNPNYPGFGHFASQLHSPGSESEDDTTSLNNINNNNNNSEDEGLNKLDTLGFKKTFYDKPKFNIVDPELCNFNTSIPVTKQMNELNIREECEKDIELDNISELSKPKMDTVVQKPKSLMDPSVMAMKEFDKNKMADAFLSGVKEEIQKCADTNRAEEDKEKAVREKEDLIVPRKKEKMEVNNAKKVREVRNLSQPANITALPPTNLSLRTGATRRPREKKRISPDIGSFDVYNIETAMPTIDLDAIESHLKAAREEERRRRNDREEIRRRLATGDTDEYYGGDRPGRKPSLQARLQSGMNLQICFMNDQMSDTESPSSDSEPTVNTISPMKPKQPSPLSKVPDNNKQSPTANGHIKNVMSEPVIMSEADLLACVGRLQTEARAALTQASDLARLQMQMERQRRSVSPITEMLRNTLHKVGVVFPQDRRRLSRQMLTDMNVAQLQVIANDLHSQIEGLNESLVKFLMERDELHMGQDSMLVDIEDLTRYLGAKENTFKEDISFNNNLPETKPPANRSARLVRK